MLADCSQADIGIIARTGMIKDLISGISTALSCDSASPWLEIEETDDVAASKFHSLSRQGRRVLTKGKNVFVILLIFCK